MRADIVLRRFVPRADMSIPPLSGETGVLDSYGRAT
jgi:hypothetical protein